MATRNLPVELTAQPSRLRRDDDPTGAVHRCGRRIAEHRQLPPCLLHSGENQIHYEDQHLRGSGGSSDPTLCRVGIYTIDGSGNGTLAASIANDTTIWSNNGVEYERAWTSPSQRSQARATQSAASASPRRPPQPRRDAGSNPLINAIAHGSPGLSAAKPTSPRALLSAPSVIPPFARFSGSSPNEKDTQWENNSTRPRSCPTTKRPPSSISARSNGRQAFSHQLNREALLATDPKADTSDIDAALATLSSAVENAVSKGDEIQAAREAVE